MADVLDRLVGDPEIVEICSCRVQFGLACHSQAQVVEANPVLVEAVIGAGPQSDDRAADVVEDAAEQEAQLLAGRIVGVVGHLEGDGPAEDRFVEIAGPRDVGDREPDVGN